MRLPWREKSVGSVNGVTVASEREDEPEFKRNYCALVGDGFKVEVSMRTSFGRRTDFSQLTQRNGKYILFDAQAVADKIIDRDLYPLVQRVVDQILAMDDEFIRSRPSRYVDERGVEWVRQ